MQNRYSGDIGDYSKFVLIKRLFGNKSVGVVWYLYPDETHNNDGKHKDYHKYSKLNDLELISVLENVANTKRDIKNLETKLKEYFENQKIKYFGDFIEDGFKKKTEKREKWIKRAVDSIKNCSVVFVDPDNGIEVKSVKKSNKKGGKYIFFDEIEKFFENSEILVVYQHFPRIKQDLFIKNRLNEIREKIKGDYYLYAIKFKPISPRVYFVFVKSNKKDEFEKGLKNFMNSPYSKGYEIFKEYKIQNLCFYAKDDEVIKKTFEYMEELSKTDPFGFSFYLKLNNKMITNKTLLENKKIENDKFYLLVLGKNADIEVTDKINNYLMVFDEGENSYIYEVI